MAGPEPDLAPPDPAIHLTFTLPGPGSLSPGTLGPGTLSPGTLGPGTLSPGTLGPRTL